MEENGDRQFDIDELQKYQITSKNFLMLTKRGTFYNAIDEDAFIISYLFNYKIIKNNVAGFPECSLIKVLNKLDEQKISYEVTYKDREPIIKKYNNINKYNAV